MDTNKNDLQLKSYYAHAYLSLKDKDYDKAIRGFKYSIKNKVEVEKAVVGLICSYSCLGKYNRALVIFEKYEHFLVLNSSYRHMLIHDLSFLLLEDMSALKKQRDGYLSSFLFGRTMKKTFEEYNQDSSNILAIIFISYWYFITGRRPNDSNKILHTCLIFPTLDKEFRWKLLRRLAITDKELLNNSKIASTFKSIPKSIDSPEYIDQLILSTIYSKDLLKAQQRIIQSNELNHEFSNEVMWNYIKLTSENNEIDEQAVFFAKTLLHIGWMDSYVATVIRYGYDNKTPHSVKKDIEKLELFGL